MKEPHFGAVPSPDRWVNPIGGISGVESRPVAAPREEQTSRGRHLPWQRPAAGTARLQFEGRAEAGAGPGLSPHPPRGRQRRVRTGSAGEDQGRGEGRASRAKSCMERQGKVSSLTAEQAPAEPSDIETICEGFGRRERAGQASPGMWSCFSSRFEAAGLPQNPPAHGGWRLPEGPWGCPGSDPCTDTSGPSPESGIEKFPGWFELRSRPPPTHSLCTRGTR